MVPVAVSSFLLAFSSLLLASASPFLLVPPPLFCLGFLLLLLLLLLLRLLLLLTAITPSFSPVLPFLVSSFTGLFSLPFRGGFLMFLLHIFNVKLLVKLPVKLTDHSYFNFAGVASSLEKILEDERTDLRLQMEEDGVVDEVVHLFAACTPSASDGCAVDCVKMLNGCGSCTIIGIL